MNIPDIPPVSKASISDFDLIRNANEEESPLWSQRQVHMKHKGKMINMCRRLGIHKQ